MSNHDGRRNPAFTRLTASMTLCVALCGGAAFAAQPQPAGTDRTVSVTIDRPGATAADDVAVASDARYTRMRLAGSLGVSVGGGFAPYPTYGAAAYCSQPGFCYPEAQVSQQQGPRRIKHRATTVERIATGPRKVKAAKVRTAKAATPKRGLVRSVAATPDPVADTSAPYAFTPGSRDRAPALAGDSTGGARATPSFRTTTGGGGGGGPGTVGDRTGGGRAVSTFRTVPSGRR